LWGGDEEESLGRVRKKDFERRESMLGGVYWRGRVSTMDSSGLLGVFTAITEVQKNVTGHLNWGY